MSEALDKIKERPEKEGRLKTEQKDIINFKKGNIIVSASAGSGKTFVMIQRLCKLVAEKNAKVDEILAVTFTESAAQDMKEKLKVALTEKIKETGDVSLVEELKKLDLADVSTLHSFASKLIKTYFFVAGVLPDFSILDDASAAELRAECLDRVFRYYYDGDFSYFKELVRAFSVGRKDDNLKKLVLDVYNFCEVEKDPSEYADSLSSLYEEENIDRVTEELFASLKSKLQNYKEIADPLFNAFKSMEYEKGIEYSGAVIDALSRALKCEDIYELKNTLVLNIDVQFSGKKPTEAEDAIIKIKEIKDRIDKITDALSAFTEAETDGERLSFVKGMTESLIAVVKKFAQDYAKEKTEQNLLDFSDLEHYTLKILSDEMVVSEIKEKYKYVFVDEYQDINGVQEAIIEKLANGNLFMVGDVKQSIYGFRGCRPEFFADKIEKMKKDGETAKVLNYNFRSAKKIVDMANEIFSYSMTEDLFGVNYARDAKLIEGGIYPSDAEGRAALHFLHTEKKEKADEQPRIYDVLEEYENVKDESDEISALVTEIIRKELGQTYFDPKDKTFKPVTLKDIAILLRSQTAFASKLVGGLKRRGIPVVSQVEENVCDFPEVDALINALKLIDKKDDDIPLAITMLSKIGKFSEQELSDIVSFERKDTFSSSVLNYAENNADALSEKIKSFFTLFEGFRLFADFNGASEVLKKLIADTGYENAIVSAEDGEIKSARIARFLSASESAPLTVNEFLRKIELSPKSFNFLRNGDENSVKIMTMHASKGLEFPVAILCGLERDMDKRDERGEVIFDRNMGLALKYYDFEKGTSSETPLRFSFKERLERNRIREELRLFYVAVTRAKYSLHVVFSGKEDKRGKPVKEASSFLDYIPPELKIELHEEQDLAFINAGIEKERTLLGAPEIERAEKLRSVFGFNYGYAQDTKLPLKADVTSVSESEKFDRAERVKAEDDVNSETGIIAHKLIENLDFLKMADIDAQVEKLKAEGVISEEELSKINLQRIESALKNSGLDGLSGKIYREKDFIALLPASEVYGVDSKEDVLIQGRIDLLIVGSDGVTIVDYKYSTLKGESLRAKYKKQLDLYALAVEKSLKIKVVEKKIVNVYSGETVFA